MEREKTTTMPRTPFSTPLSGSARETEMRLRNIFSGPKKRPPVLFLVLMFSICIFCGNLVSCQVAEAEVPEGSAQLEEDGSRPVIYQSGEQPLSELEQMLLESLFQAAEAEHPFQAPTAQLMNYMQKDGWVFGSVFVEDHLENTLILGVMDEASGKVPGPIFQCSVHAGVPNVVTFQDDGGCHVLYTLNGQMNGQYHGEAGVFLWDGIRMARKWPAEEDAPDGYAEYWNSHLAVMAPGGVDIYTADPDFEWGKEEPASMWQLETDELFYADPSGADILPMPVYFQSLRWLNEHTGDPGGWQVLSLALDEERSDPEGMVDCFTLRARSWVDGEELTADLYFPYDQEGARRSYDGLDHGEERDEDVPDPDGARPDEKDGGWDWEDKFDEEWEKEQEAKQIAEYQSVGVTMDGKDYWYQGQLVNIFLDQRPDRSVYTLDQNPAGTVDVKILRADDGTIVGAAYLTDAERAELADLFED